MLNLFPADLAALQAILLLDDVGELRAASDLDVVSDTRPNGDGRWISDRFDVYSIVELRPSIDVPVILGRTSGVTDLLPAKLARGVFYILRAIHLRIFDDEFAPLQEVVLVLLLDQVVFVDVRQILMLTQLLFVTLESGHHRTEAIMHFVIPAGHMLGASDVVRAESGVRLHVRDFFVY